ncbi:unnamed protein product [Ixodes pacificus]
MPPARSRAGSRLRMRLAKRSPHAAESHLAKALGPSLEMSDLPSEVITWPDSFTTTSVGIPEMPNFCFSSLSREKKKEDTKMEQSVLLVMARKV